MRPSSDLLQTQNLKQVWKTAGKRNGARRTREEVKDTLARPTQARPVTEGTSWAPRITGTNTFLRTRRPYQNSYQPTKRNRAETDRADLGLPHIYNLSFYIFAAGTNNTKYPRTGRSPSQGSRGPPWDPMGPKIDQKARAGFIMLSSLRSAQKQVSDGRKTKRARRRERQQVKDPGSTAQGTPCD
jgi:hypothetical protein